MLFILASVFCSTVILVLFRSIDSTVAQTRHAILTSYLMSAFTGAVFIDSEFAAILSSRWFWIAALEGVCFYAIFQLMAATAQKSGVAVAGVATKMSVVIPISIGLIFLGESINIYKVAGIVLGVLAVLLTAADKMSVKGWFLPLMAFFCTGLLDASFKLLQVYGLTQAQFPGFIVITFGFAFLSGLLFHFARRETVIHRSSLFYGVFLGLANFGTVYFILRALAAPNWESSLVYPLNHFGVVAASALAAYIVFSERPGWLARIGLALALISIVLLYFAV